MVRNIKENWMDDELDRIEQYNNPKVNPITTKAFQNNLRDLLFDLSSAKRTLENGLIFCLDDSTKSDFPDLYDAVNKLQKAINKYGRVLNNYRDF